MNDGPMFGFFPISCGVANVSDFPADSLSLPRYIAQSRGGAGFVEVADRILAAQARRATA